MALEKNGVPDVCVKTRSGGIVGTGTLFKCAGKLELRSLNTGAKYMHMAKGAAGATVETVLDDPMAVVGAVSYAAATSAVKSAVSALTHTAAVSRYRVKNELAGEVMDNIKQKYNNYYDRDQFSTKLWTCNISKDTSVQLNNNQILITALSERYILEFTSVNKAKKCFKEISDYC